MAAPEPGDTLVVWRLDRLGRSMPHLVSLVDDLLGKGIGFRSLLDGAIDTTAARARGRLGGRRPISPNDPRVVTAKRLHRDRSLSIDQICATLGISRPTFYRYLALAVGAETGK